MSTLAGYVPVVEEPSVRAPKAPRALWFLGCLVAVPAAIPVVYLVWAVFQSGGFDAGGFSAERLLALAWNTALLVITVTLTTVVMGFTTAWLTTRTDLKGAGVWSTLMTVPLVIPSYVGATAMLAASGNSGTLTHLLNAIGLPGLPVFQGFWPTWAALSLWNFSFVHLLAVPVLRRLDPALEDIARGLGASRSKTIVTVVLPQLRPALAGGALLVSLYVLSEFGAVSMLRYETFTRAIYTQFQARIDPEPALFLAGLLSMGALVIVVIQLRVRGRAALYTNRAIREVRPQRLTRRGRFAAQLFLGGIVTLALVLPLSTLVWWTVLGMSLGNSPLSVLPHVLRSVMISSTAAIVVAVAALPVAILAVRFPSLRARALETVSWLAYALPHLAIGLAFLVLAIRIAPLIYQTVVILLIAYVAMFLPLAFTGVESGLRRVGPGFEEVSRSLGVGAVGTVRRVTIPLLWSSMLAGAALVFLSVMKELPATLLLRPTEFDTLPVRIWSASNQLLYTQASFACLALILVSAIPVYFFVVRGLHD